MKYLIFLFIIWGTGCATHSHSSYYTPYLLIWDDSYEVRTLRMRGLEECLRAGYAMPQDRFKCIPMSEYRGYNSNVRFHLNARIR